MQEQESKLRQEILDDARRKAERTRKRADQDAAKLLAQAKKDHAARRAERLDAVQRTAEEKARAVLASTDQEIRRQALTAEEQVLEELFAVALERASGLTGADREGMLTRLAEEAAAGVAGASLTVALSPADAADCGPAVAAAAAKAAGLDGDSVSVVSDTSVKAGVLVRSSDGRRQFDNTLEVRLQRLKPELRPGLHACLGGEQTAPEEG